MPYGCAGCRCWADDSWTAGDPDDVVWQPNAHCPHHGLLVDLDTEGTAPVPRHPTTTQAEEAYAYLREEIHSAAPACPYEGMYGPHDHIPGADSDVCVVAAEQPNEEQNDHGDGVTIFATCRRWLRRFGDWLDPHARHRREYRELQREWARQFRTDLDGGDAGTEGGERRVD
jgi:hypothetical protein